MFNGIIEPATPADHAWIKALWTKHEDVLGSVFKGVWREFLAGAAWIDVARPAEGFQCYRPLSSWLIQSHGMAVVEPGKGVGRALREHLLAWLEPQGRTLTFSIYADNTASLALHDRMGFVRVGTTKDSVNGKTIILYRGRHD
jgi:GNAT superfamily N-acetyltransferase